MSGLIKFRDEGAIIGRLLTGYADLELDLLHCVHNATKDFDGTLKAMFGRRGETRRINKGAELGEPAYLALNLKDDFSAAILAMRYCLKIRNQYAHHTFWNDNSGQLAIGALEEIAKLPTRITDLREVQVQHVDVSLLQAQEHYFRYTDKQLAWVNYEGRFRNGFLTNNPCPKPTAPAQPALHL